ncbi:MAG: class I SAM-dependent methyltransferase [Pseudomonadota bacterium]
MAFDVEWLALREPADHAARDLDLLQRAIGLAGAVPRILDIACGTGSTLRAFAPHVSQRATWRLLDNDATLLERAGQNSPTAVETYSFDISNPHDIPVADASLVTASALLDLVSETWLEALVASLCARDLPFYAALSYDGRMNWTPRHEEDDLVTEAFNRHQRLDKGFGPALGPDAVPVARRLFEARGYVVSLAASDWRFDNGACALKDRLTRDIATAAAEAGYTAMPDWQAQAGSRALVVGHLDLLAMPARPRSN